MLPPNSTAFDYEMGSNSSLMLQDEEIAVIQEETGCEFLASSLPEIIISALILSLVTPVTPSQIERLYSRFTSLDKGDNGTLSRDDFLRIPELAINPLGERIVQAFFDESNGEERINFRQFMKVLARFRPIKKNRENKLNSKVEKLRFAFKMYDLDSDEKITRDELLSILHMMVGANISNDQLASIADRTIMEADRDGDQCISFEEFCNILERTDVEEKMSIRFLH